MTKMSINIDNLMTELRKSELKKQKGGSKDLLSPRTSYSFKSRDNEGS